MENNPNRKGLFWNCYLTVSLEAGTSVLLAPVGGAVDVRGYDATRKINWRSPDLVGEALRVYSKVTDPEFLKEVELAFVNFLAKRTESAEHKDRAGAEKRSLPTPQNFDREAVQGVVSILEPDPTNAKLLLENLEKAALTPGAFLAESGRITTMSDQQCRSYTCTKDLLEGELHDRGHMTALDWKANGEDLVSSVKTLTGLDIAIPQVPEQALSELLPLAGAQLRNRGLALIEYGSDTDNHIVPAIDRDFVATFRRDLNGIGIKTIDHSVKPTLFNRLVKRR